MRYLIAALMMSLLVGCASGPKLLMVKNCKSLGSDLYQCEEIPSRDIQGGSKHL